MKPIRAYQVFGVLVLVALGWTDLRGWSPGTEEEAEQEQAASDQRQSIRHRGYRGGK